MCPDRNGSTRCCCCLKSRSGSTSRLRGIRDNRKPISKILSPGDIPDIDHIKELARRGEVLRTEKECLTKGGAPVPVLFSVGTSSDAHAAVEIAADFSVVCIMLDIRDRKKLEIELRFAQKLESIGQLAAGIAHEINTPTQFIGDNTRFLHDAFEELRPVLQNCQEIAAIGESVEGTIPRGMIDFLRRTHFEYLLKEIPLAIMQSTEGVERISKIVQSMKEFSHPGTDTKKEIDLNHAIETTLTIAKE